MMSFVSIDEYIVLGSNDRGEAEFNFKELGGICFLGERLNETKQN